MQIDWLTVAAQIVNFLVLVWLLKRFLYQPVLDAMAKREQLIQDRLATAEQREETASEEAAHYRQEREDLAEEREQLLTAARHEADEIRHKLKEEARAEVDKLRQRWLQELEAEEEQILADIAGQVSRQTFQASRRVLAELADSELEVRMVKVFLDKLDDIGAEERTSLAAATAGNEVSVATAFDLPDNLRSEIERRVSSLLGLDSRIRFETVPEFVCGIELEVGAHKVAWNITDYLGELEQNVVAGLRMPTKEP